MHEAFRTVQGQSPFERAASLEKFLFSPIQDIPGELVFPFLEDDDKKVRRLAAQVLGRLRHPALFPFIVEVLPTLETDEKVTFIGILRRLGDKAATLALIDYLFDSHAEVRSAAAGAIAGFGEEATRLAAESLGELSREDRVKVIRAFGGLPVGGEQVFRVALTDDDIWVRREVVYALAKKESAASTNLILKAAEDTFPLVRLEAVRALRGRRGRKVEETLRNLREDPNAEVASAVSAVLSSKK